VTHPTKWLLVIRCIEVRISTLANIAEPVPFLAHELQAVGRVGNDGVNARLVHLAHGLYAVGFND
jgi:hypothetical protein